MEWKQIVFGKLIQHPEGPIVQGFEHECTGKTQSVPSDITPLLSPSRLGPGISDLTNWSLYPWIEIGGVSIEYVMSDDEPWLIVCRARGRSEQGEGKAGRWYTQAHYLMMRAKDFSPVSLLSVFDHVRARPMLKRDFSLPCISIQESP